jgi:gamma-glutamyltranspeptidase/glutathione hydrolase
MNLGSAGGSGIINYVAKTLVAYIDWQMNIQEAISLPNYRSRNRETEMEQDGNWSSMMKDLKDRGHIIRYFDSPSGLQGITRGSKISEGKLSLQYLNSSNPKEWVLFGGADPRREGVVLGD